MTRSRIVATCSTRPRRPAAARFPGYHPHATPTWRPPIAGSWPSTCERRADLVHALAAGITADHLPATACADQLCRFDPDLAGQLAVWRGDTVIADHPQPLGLIVSPEPPGRAQLGNQLRPQMVAGPPAPRRVPDYPAAARRLTLARRQQLAEQHSRLASHRDRHRGQAIHR